MQIAIYGPGRAGGSLALAFSRAGHVITAIEGRSADAVGGIEGEVPVAGGDPDLVVIAVSDDAIESVAASLVLGPPVPAVIHVSGAVPVDALRSCADRGAAVGSFHPLQTLPDRHAGADKLAGSYVAVTADGNLYRDLDLLARSIGCTPFPVDDQHKPIYHAAAAAAANFVVASLSIAHRLIRTAGVDPDVLAPLVTAIINNVVDLGPDDALTGPIARGDVGTVQSQIEAIRTAAPQALEPFLLMARATAIEAGTIDSMEPVLL